MHRVLIVDDEPHVTRLIQQRLRSEGYDTVTASNGMAALAKMESDGPFDVVVTDYNMPKMNGRQLCQAIRERYSEESIFIFVVTARLDGPFRQWTEGQSQLEYIEKPLSLQDLIGRLSKCFASDDGEGESEGPSDD